MIDKIIVIDDILDNPDEVVEFAIKQKYYTPEECPNPKKIKINWKGMRSDIIDKIVAEPLFAKIFKKINELTPCKHLTIKNDSFFHMMTENDVYNDTWPHSDVNDSMAGVIYLTKNPIESCGTMIYQKEDDSEPIIVENAYNRLVLYNGKLLHSAIGGGFGKRCDDCRLTIVFFTYMTSVNMPVIS